MLLLHTDAHFALQDGDLHLWLATCANANETQRRDVYLKAARIGRLDVLSNLAPTFDTSSAHENALCAALVYKQFACADWIEHSTSVDMFFVEHIFNHAVHFNFDAKGENIPIVDNDRPFFQYWIDHQNMKKCQIQKEIIEKELEPNSSSRVRKI